jgi:hypothetical protein
MAKSDWLNHLKKTYKTLKQSNPEAKLKDAMRTASKTFKKVAEVIDTVVPKKRNTGRHRGKKSRKNKTKKARGGKSDLEKDLLE